jgi:ubiquitin-conjugating enzyme E2 variant
MQLFIFQFLLGWLVADLLSGILHWVQDRTLGDGANWIGRRVVAPAQLHHRDPSFFLENSFVTPNKTTWLVIVPIASLWLAALGPSIILLGALSGGLLVNEVHRLTHRPPEAGSWLRVLQQIGIIQSPAGHARHHRATFTNYCTLTDWLNPAIEKIELWNGLERILLRFGIPISRGIQ